MNINLNFLPLNINAHLPRCFFKYFYIIFLQSDNAGPMLRVDK